MCRVRQRSFLSTILLVGALLGLIAAPLEQSSFASAAPTPATMQMADAMPCCHDQAPAKDCQKSCPLMAMCVNQTLLERMKWHVSVPMQIIAFIRPTSDAPSSGIESVPPTRPPKSIA
jgi:hypothetical protein